MAKEGTKHNTRQHQEKQLSSTHVWRRWRISLPPPIGKECKVQRAQGFVILVLSKSRHRRTVLSCQLFSCSYRWEENVPPLRVLWTSLPSREVICVRVKRNGRTKKKDKGMNVLLSGKREDLCLLCGREEYVLCVMCLSNFLTDWNVCKSSFWSSSSSSLCGGVKRRRERWRRF